MLFTLHNLMSPLAALFGVFIGLPFLLIPCNSQFNYLYRDSFRSSIYMPKRSQTSFLNFFLLSATHISPKKTEKKNVLAGPNKYQYIHTVVNIHTYMYASHSRSIRTKATSMGTVQPERIATK